MRMKTTKSSKTKRPVTLKDLEPKKNQPKGGGRASSGEDIIVGAGPGAPGGHVK